VNACFCCVRFSFSIPSQEIGERLRNDLFCVEWDVKTQLLQDRGDVVTPSGASNEACYSVLYSGTACKRQIKMWEKPYRRELQ